MRTGEYYGHTTRVGFASVVPPPHVYLIFMLPCIIHFIIHNPRPCSIRSLYLRFFRGISAPPPPSLLACLPCQFFDSQIVIRFNSLGSIGLTTKTMMMIFPQTLYRTCTYFYVFKIKKWRLQGLLLRDWSPPGSRRSGGPHTTAMEGSGFYLCFFWFIFFYVFVIIKLKGFLFFFKPVNKWAARRSRHITDPGGGRSRPFSECSYFGGGFCIAVCI